MAFNQWDKPLPSSTPKPSNFNNTWSFPPGPVDFKPKQVQRQEGLPQYHQPVDYRMPPPQQPHYPEDATFIYKTQLQVPKIVQFSGDEPPQKGDVSYQEWHFEVSCLANDPDVQPNILIQAIRKSLRGTARKLLIPLGENATVAQIMHKLDNFFGDISTNGMIMQQFFNEYKKSDESVTSFGCRLETLLQTAIDKGYIGSEGKNDLLKHKFWTSLNDQELQSQTRHKYDTIDDYTRLLWEIRQVEKEIKDNKQVGVKSGKRLQHQAIVEDPVEALEKRMNTKLENLEKKIMGQIDDKLNKILNKFDNLQMVCDSKPPTNLSSRGRYNNGNRGRGWSRGSGRGYTVPNNSSGNNPKAH